MITVSPKRGLTAIEDEKLREKLEAYKKSLGAEEIQAIVDGTKELKEYQDTPSPKEDLEKIPLLKRSDIRKEAEKFILTEREIGGTKVLHMSSLPQASVICACVPYRPCTVQGSAV